MKGFGACACGSTRPTGATARPGASCLGPSPRWRGPGGRPPPAAGGIAARVATIAVVAAAALVWRGGGSGRRPTGEPAPRSSAAPRRWAAMAPAPPAALAFVRGVVRDANGALVTGASVALARASASPAAGPELVASGESDGSGRFRFDAVPPGTYAASAASGRPGATPATLPPPLLAPGENGALVLTLGRDGVLLTGRVLDAGGGPVPHARVALFPGALRLSVEGPALVSSLLPALVQPRPP